MLDSVHLGAESAAEGSLSERSASPSTDISMAKGSIDLVPAERRASKPTSSPSAPARQPLFASKHATAPYPRELEQWIDMPNSTVVDVNDRDFNDNFFYFGRYVLTKIEPVAEQAAPVQICEERRCGDIDNCEACYPTEAIIESSLGEFAERPVCIHEDTKYSTQQVMWIGLYKLTWGEDTFWFYNGERGDPVGTDGRVTCMRETYFIVPGRDGGELIQKLIEAVEKVAERTRERPILKERTIRVYRWHHGCGEWDRKMTITGRSIASVIIPEAIKEKIIADLDRFFSKETAQWYEKHGLPYKRSMLFHGLPGTGKTSLITALAAKYQRNVCFLQPQHPNFTDDAFKTCMERVPRRAIVVLEDIDALFEGREKASGSTCPLTFSGLLNALDGMTYESGCVFVMTTNHVERLDPALIRAGRCDLKIPFTYATKWQLGRFFLKFYPEADPATCGLFVANTCARFPEGVTLAETQQHFIDCMFEDAQACARKMRDYQPVPTVVEDDRKTVVADDEAEDDGNPDDEIPDEDDDEGSGDESRGGGRRCCRR